MASLLVKLQAFQQDVLWHEFTKFGPARGSSAPAMFAVNVSKPTRDTKNVEPEMLCESATVDVAFGIFWQERYGKMLSLGPRRLHKR